MSKIKGFRALRPAPGLAGDVASLPYDVMNRAEAKEMAAGKKHSFLNIVRAEINLPDSVDAYDPSVYELSRKTLDQYEKEGVLVQDDQECLYIYRQIMHGRVQTGIVACASIQEYMDNLIKKHELTREAKEQDRIRHFDACDANTAPIFLTYRHRPLIDQIVRDFIKFNKPSAQIETEDGIIHICWKIDNADLNKALIEEFAKVDALYIADGHHRCASAAKVGLKRREQFPDAGPEAEFNYFMAVIFPDDDLYVMDYNRVVKDLNGNSPEEFFEKVKAAGFTIKDVPQDKPFRPMEKGVFGLFLDGRWYALEASPKMLEAKDPVERLDVQILQKYLLQPILAIDDPRTSERIDFVGGIRGLEELERRARGDMRLAFAMYPTSMDELLEIADSGAIMPPKSTWFEPKLRSGLFVHKLH